MSPHIKIFYRNAKLADARSIAEVRTKSWQAAYRGLVSGEFLDDISVDECEDRLEATALSEDSLASVWVAEANGIIIGFSIIGPARDNDLDSNQIGEVFAIYLVPKYWRHGVGRSLINKCIDDAKSRRYGKLVVWVIQGNEKALRFYLHVGFVKDGTSELLEKVPGIAGNQLNVVRLSMEIPSF